MGLHAGYRQPSLSAVYDLTASFLTPEPVRHIRWPVNIQDLNWYLYELPGKNHEDPWWFLWLTDKGAERVVEEGYGDSAVPAGVKPDCELDGNELLVEKIECKDLPGGAYFPFQAGDGSPGLNPEMLVRQGVESPVDIDDLGPRNLSVFSFAVKEAEPMGRASQSGEAVMRRYGVPLHREKMENYFEEWARKPIDPTRSYLMVFTYYESLNSHAIGGRGIMFQKSDKGGDRYRLPKRHIRRVVCRMLVSPSGFTPAADQGFNPIRDLKDKVKEAIGSGLDVMAGWVGGLLRGVLHFPGWAVKQGGALTCGGLEKVDELTAAAAVERAGARVGWEDGEPVMFVNAAVRSRTEGFEDCVRVSAPVVPTCESSTDVIFQGRCVQLPRVRLSPEKVRFVDLHAEEEYQRWETVWEKPESEVGNPVLSYGEEEKSRSFQPSFDVGLHTINPVPQGQDLKPPAPDNVGLTRVSLGWEFLGGDDSPDLRRAIKGYVVYVWPDPKSSDLSEGEGWAFILPSWVKEKQTDRSTGGDHYHKIEGFNVGDLDHYGSRGSKPTGSTTLVSVENNYVFVNDVIPLAFDPLGSEVVQSNYGWFVERVGNLPLAPGFSHRFAVAPYIGEPGYSSFALGPVSESVVLDGDKAACLAGESAAEGSISPEEWRHIQKLYDCRGAGSGLDGGYVNDTFRVGLLGLTGTRLCYDIFSSTPPEFTWDNPIVRQVWALVWIIADGVLFALLVWQGMRMTYDVWIEPRPSVGFRELALRFLLAVALAAGSLYIAQFVLILASDLTCFVAQVTSMTMWGLVGNTFGALLDGFMAWHTSFIEDVEGMHLAELLKSVFFALALALVLVIFVIALLVLFIKVSLAMLMRIALLAVLIALSPLAFAFYASDTTAHWTKRWVSMFLGTTFQQVFVLIVVYIGGHLAGHYMEVGVEGSVGEMVIGFLLAFLTLALADKVPSIVNPSGQGLFCSFSQLGSMAVAGTVMVAAVGLGAVAGPLGPAAGAVGRRFTGGGGGPGSGGSGGLGMAVPMPGGGGPGGGGPPRPFSSVRGTSFGGVGAGAGGGVSRRASRHGGGDGGRDGGRGLLWGGPGGGTGCCRRRTGWGCQRCQRRRSWPGGGSRVGPFQWSRGSRVVSSRRADSRRRGSQCVQSRYSGSFRAGSRCVQSRYSGSFRAGSRCVGSRYGDSCCGGSRCAGSFRVSSRCGGSWRSGSRCGGYCCAGSWCAQSGCSCSFRAGFRYACSFRCNGFRRRWTRLQGSCRSRPWRTGSSPSGSRYGGPFRAGSRYGCSFRGNGSRRWWTRLQAFRPRSLRRHDFSWRRGSRHRAGSWCNVSPGAGSCRAGSRCGGSCRSGSRYGGSRQGGSCPRRRSPPEDGSGCPGRRLVASTDAGGRPPGLPLRRRRQYPLRRYGQRQVPLPPRLPGRRRRHAAGARAPPDPRLL